jgi:hypothetical protein
LILRLFVPNWREKGRTPIVALPLLSATAVEEYVPLLNETVPVGIGPPAGAATLTDTPRDCAVVMLAEDNVTVIAGVAVVTDTDAVPAAFS